MSVYKKLMQARIKLQAAPLKKSGENTFAKYKYLTLDDFLPTTQSIFADVGLCGVVSFTADTATLRVVDVDDGTEIVFASPMGSAALKGCHEVQNIGAVETYQRRYLWVTAMEIVEHDALDATTGKDEPVKAKITPTAGAWEAMDPDQQSRLEFLADSVKAELSERGALSAVNMIKEEALPPEEMTALWTRFDSKQRSAMKAAAAVKREPETV